MGGVMPDRDRDAAIKRLRKAASKLIVARCDTIVIPSTLTKRDEKDALLAMVAAWRRFPECEQDEQVPSPADVLDRCDAYDCQKAEAERIAELGTAAMLGRAR